MLMGSRGSFLESGGFSTPAKWHTVNFVGGIKVLAPIDPKASMSLPERSNTPGTSYLSYRKDGRFDQLRVFGEDRVPRFDIDYGKHQGKTTLHVHYYKDGVRQKVGSGDYLKPGHPLYERYKHLFKGVK